MALRAQPDTVPNRPVRFRHGLVSHSPNMALRAEPDTVPQSPCSLSSWPHLTHLRCVMALPTCKPGRHRHVRFHHGCTSYISDVSLHTQTDTSPITLLAFVMAASHIFPTWHCVRSLTQFPIALFAFAMASSHTFQTCHCVRSLTRFPNHLVLFRPGRI
jgi:hypothetical protein